MEDFVELCLIEAEKHKTSFADARVFSTMNESLEIKRGQVETAGTAKEKGFNVRVIYNGAWGYATSSVMTKENIPMVVSQAIEVAKASAKKLKKPVELTEEPIIKDKYVTPYKIDPFEVDIEEKLAILKNSNSILGEAGEQIRVNSSSLDAYRINIHFGNSEGTRIEQEQTYLGWSLQAVAAGMEIHTRSSRDYKMMGFEFVKDFDFDSEAKRVAKEALLLVNEAINAPTGKTAFILEPDQLGLTIHESTGHPSELDRVMGYEADFAGTSFLTLDKLGSDYKYGSELTNLVVDPTIPNSIGSIKYDDEGVKTKKFSIVENGIFKNYMTDRETAKEIGYEHSFGNSRMANYNRLPIVRMSNLHLLPDPTGPKDIDEMIAETSKGVFGLTWKSHSIDDKRMNFQFSTEMGWLIENGEKTKPLKNLCYNAATPEFWAGLDMITQEFRSYGHGPVCGKGVPLQAIWIEHGGGWARFQNVQVFSS
ncbi:MAG: TldD/PmbA family protein [Candidatus Kariarchaeaceae archaeon]